MGMRLGWDWDGEGGGSRVLRALAVRQKLNSELFQKGSIDRRCPIHPSYIFQRCLSSPIQYWYRMSSGHFLPSTIATTAVSHRCLDLTVPCFKSIPLSHHNLRFFSPQVIYTPLCFRATATTFIAMKGMHATGRGPLHTLKEGPNVSVSFI